MAAIATCVLCGGIICWRMVSNGQEIMTIDTFNTIEQWCMKMGDATVASGRK